MSKPTRIILTRDKTGVCAWPDIPLEPPRDEKDDFFDPSCRLRGMETIYELIEHLRIDLKQGQRVTIDIAVGPVQT